tara:strand:+ start:152 stop:2095 length:1944 start_codon:yes stop_codon:yes gene_type:complete
MSLKKNRNQGTNVGASGSPKLPNSTKRVADIILSANHPAYVSSEDIGIIFFTEVGFNQEALDVTRLPKAKPLNKNNFQYPVVGELVQIISSPSNNIYNDLEGDISNTVSYYTPAINVHNNTASNALPNPKKTKKTKPKRSSKPGAFQFKKEFKSKNREIARKQLSNYLRNLGYTSGTNDPRAPRYSLFENASGEYIFRLDDSKDNKKVAIKLGNYFKENPELQPLTPSEGDSIMEGKNGQRIRFTTTGPTGTNAISNNVTDVPDDGNPNIGDKAMVLSLGNDTQENVTKDAASIYLLENQSIPIDATSTNIDSLNSEYKPVTDPLEDISKSPAQKTPSPLEEGESTIQPISFGFNFPETEKGVIEPNSESGEESDPVFAALDEAQDEKVLDFITSTYDISEGEDISAEFKSTDADIVQAPSEAIISTNSNYNNISPEALYTNTAAPLGTKGLTLATLIRSSKAKELNIANYPGADKADGKNYTAPDIMNNLNGLAYYCLDPLLEQYPNLIVSSGLRVNDLNNAVLGSATSEHRLGRAADISVPGVFTYEIFNFIVNNNIPYNQLIWEFPEKGSRSWIHISYVLDGLDDKGKKKVNNKFNKTIASKNDPLKKALENQYVGQVKFRGTYARRIGINEVPDHRTLEYNVT